MIRQTELGACARRRCRSAKEEIHMTRNFFNIQTSSELLGALQGATQRRQTASELLEQRVSFVYGSMSQESGVTREQVRKLILEQEGAEVALR